MKKRAVIYNKWLHTLGGGEVVACNLANVLKELGYDVTILCKNRTRLKDIKQILNIELREVSILAIGESESEIKQKVWGAELFFNLTFIDYSSGYAKKNIYYFHFPQKPWETFKRRIYNKYITPVFLRVVNPHVIHFYPKAIGLIHGKPAYDFKSELIIKSSNIDINSMYDLEFSLHLDYFYKVLLEKFNYKINNCEIVYREVKVDYQRNLINFKLTIKADKKNLDLFFNLNNLRQQEEIKHLLGIRLVPHSLKGKILQFLYDVIYSNQNTMIYLNLADRVHSYQKFITHSDYVNKWVKAYWGKKAITIYPPVELLFKKYNIDKTRKVNKIISVGRFFTLGHGKKQEALIKAFKKIYARGFKNWQLHLVGRLGNERSSLVFLEQLKKISKGYPIFFHINVSRKKVEKLLLESRIYWHATGFGENPDKDPVKLEHFGISVVEAISAGCFPIVFKGGGLVEIINLAGFDNDSFFTSIKDLVNKTIKAFKYNHKLKKEIEDNLYKNFSSDVFKSKIQSIL